MVFPPIWGKKMAAFWACARKLSWTLLSPARVQPLYGAGRKESSGTGLEQWRTRVALRVEDRYSFLDRFLHSSWDSNEPFLGASNVISRLVKSQVQVSIFCIKTNQWKSCYVENVSVPFGTKQGNTSKHNRFTYLRRRNAVERRSTCRLNTTWYFVTQRFGLRGRKENYNSRNEHFKFVLFAKNENGCTYVCHVCRLKLHKDENISYKASRMDGHSKNGG